MKKNKFVSGLSARLALAVVALTTMFASCSNEDIEIDVKPINAKAQILPVVIANGVDVTTQATITYSEGNGTYEAANIPAKAITVTASFNGLSDSKVINIPALSAGQTWSQTVVITLAFGEGDFETQVVASSVKEVITATTEAKTYDNPSDYWYNVPITYNQTVGAKVVSYEINDNNQALKDFINAKNIETTTTKVTKDFPVYAHSRLTAKINTIVKTATYNVVLKTRAGETVLATYTLEETNTSVDADSNGQIPGHGHAPAGHGHGHGHGSGNAGGGIIFAD